MNCPHHHFYLGLPLVSNSKFTSFMGHNIKLKRLVKDPESDHLGLKKPWLTSYETIDKLY